MELSIEEVNLIHEHRRQKAEELRPKIVHLLDVASRFATWLHTEGAGSTYSTFCDDFGYDAVEGENRSKLYEQIMLLLGSAKEIVIR